MTEGADQPAEERPSSPRRRHDEDVARQMRENLKKRKARQRARRDGAPGSDGGTD